MLRRELLKNVAAGTAVAMMATGAQSKPEDDDACAYHAKCLAEALQNRHGGEWLIEVGHETMTVFGRRLA